MFQKILVNKKGKSELKNSLKLLKNYINTVSCFHKCSKEFHEYIKRENLSNK